MENKKAEIYAHRVSSGASTERTPLDVLENLELSNSLAKKLSEMI